MANDSTWKKKFNKYDYDRKIVQKASFYDLAKLSKELTEKYDNKRIEYLRKKGYALKVFSIWPQVAGEALATHSSPYFINNFEVHIICDNAIYASQIQLNAPLLLKEIRKKTGMNLNRIKVKVGTIDWKKLNYIFDNADVAQVNNPASNLKMQDIMSPNDKLDLKKKNPNFDIILRELQ